ncbi:MULTISPECIES: helix-turn-helix domain-containing protein [Pirellulaceae]|uniref:Helix-turn-helix domain protein n=2 Tax=Pirellulaceae TaxID=2691357 RepID=A0A5C6EKZ7_9BACT|nr:MULTISPECIES: helix-turn-helix domain-containing protein [Pirellulaceae]ELP30214.1 protein containing Excisionase/Xis, DNA-binding domain protein [Rhodopirellula baltica SWK14]TWU49508.1 Helix-turn-helix domain protein [Rubripirellula reticaptiva]
MLLTIKDVAKRLNISLSKAYAIVSQGDLPSYQIGSARRVAEDDLKDYLEGCRTEHQRLPEAVKRHF